MVIRKLSCGEGIPGLRGLTVGDYWSWAYSDLLNNTDQGVFAEFLGTAALGVLDEPRIGWDAVDLRYSRRVCSRNAGFTLGRGYYITAHSE